MKEDDEPLNTTTTTPTMTSDTTPTSDTTAATSQQKTSPPTTTSSTCWTDPAQRPLRKGDLVRVSQSGLLKSKRLNDREGHLGRIRTVTEDKNGNPLFLVDWILGGRLAKVERSDLVYTSAVQEGMTDDQDDHATIANTAQTGGGETTASRKRKPPNNYMEDAEAFDDAKRRRREELAANST